MGHLNKLKILLDIFKDKSSLIKSTLTTKRKISSIHRAIIRATTRSVSSPPSDARIAAVLSFGHGTRRTAAACITAIMDRLHATRSAFVALKCLFTIHNVISRGSFILKDQLSFYPASGGRNFLNLSMFRDQSDADTLRLSSWVRWYAGALEGNLMVSRVLGYYICDKKTRNREQNVVVLSSFKSDDLLREVDVLVGFVEEICDLPSSLDLRRHDLVYEIVKLVSEDYGFVQREIFSRVVELGDRSTSLSVVELTQLSEAMKRYEGCKERLSLLFVNRNRNDALWDLVKDTRTKILTAINVKLNEKSFIRLSFTVS